ncbi:MAG: NUDIX hydrolase [Candidatus Doudnabacteria bacterium]|nr:NUDIX hydrolase [Candidatus Doudnabacteria bacterium]
MKEKELNKKQVYDGKLIRVWTAEVELEDGTHATREYVERKFGSVTGVLLDNDQNVYLVREFRSAIGEYNVNFPAGRYNLEKETPDEAIVRELREEVGLRPRQVQGLFSLKGGGTYLWPSFYFYCTDPIPDPLEQDYDERIEVIKKPFKAYLREVLRGARLRSGDYQALVMVALRLGLLEVKE